MPEGTCIQVTPDQEDQPSNLTAAGEQQAQQRAKEQLAELGEEVAKLNAELRERIDTESNTRLEAYMKQRLNDLLTEEREPHAIEKATIEVQLTDEWPQPGNATVVVTPEATPHQGVKDLRTLGEEHKAMKAELTAKAEQPPPDAEWRPGLIGMQVYDLLLKQYRTVVDQKPDGKVQVKDGNEVGTWLFAGEYEVTRYVGEPAQPKQEQPAGEWPITPETAPAAARILVRATSLPYAALTEVTILEWAPSGKRVLLRDCRGVASWSEELVSRGRLVETLPQPKPRLIDTLFIPIGGSLLDLLRDKPGASATIKNLDKLARQETSNRDTGDTER